MGNTLYKQIKIKDRIANNESCPICLLDFKKTSETTDLTLACNHKLHLNCGFLLCKNFLIDEDEINCPICRKNINVSEINLFLKNNILNLEIEDPSEWTRKDVIELTNCKVNTLSRTNYPNLSDNILLEKFFYIPLIKKRYINIPFYFKIKNLSYINIIDHELVNSSLNFQVFLSAIINYKYYENYFINLIKLIQQNFFKHDLSSIEIDYRNMNKYRRRIRLCIEDIEKIKIFDTYNGEIKDGFILENLRSEVIVKPIIFIENKKIFYINKVISVLYY